MANDTTVLEYTAEDLIAHKLQRSREILVAKPKFDQEGADLLALLEVNDMAKFCRIQCKGRSLVNSNHAEVRIPCRYVTDGFVVFVFVETGQREETHLFCFLGNEVVKWKVREAEYVLPLSRDFSRLDAYRFSDARIDDIKRVIHSLSVKTEISLSQPVSDAMTVHTTEKISIDRRET